VAKFIEMLVSLLFSLTKWNICSQDTHPFQHCVNLAIFYKWLISQHGIIHILSLNVFVVALLTSNVVLYKLNEDASLIGFEIS
jgi:hypothetical protein